MARLPTPGSDKDTWGNVLNDYLLQSHDGSGLLKAGSVGNSQLQDDAVTADNVADNSLPQGKVQNLPSDLANKLNTSARGAANGVASLDSGTKVPVSELPTGTGATQVAAGNHTHTLDALSDVSTSGAADGQALIHTGGSWAPGSLNSGGYARITSSGSWAVPTGVSRVYVRAIGGGGGGGGGGSASSTSDQAGGGGGGAGAVTDQSVNVTPGQNLTITIGGGGPGGPGGAAGGNAGVFANFQGRGESTTVTGSGISLTAAGGGGGFMGGANSDGRSPGGIMGMPNGGYTGGFGAEAIYPGSGGFTNGYYAAPGAPSAFGTAGGGGGGKANATNGGGGGTAATTIGIEAAAGGGGAAVTTTGGNGAVPTLPGSGGGGGGGGAVGGAGGDGGDGSAGQVEIWW